MSFFSQFTGGQPTNKKVSIVERGSDVVLTTKGEDRIKRLEPTGYEWRILTSIKDQQPCTLDDIAKKENIPYDKTRYLVLELIRENKVMVKE